jgi:hypothetical protein
MSRKRVIATLAVVAVVLVVAAGAVTAQEGSASNRHGSGNQLAGTWIVTVMRPAPLPPLIVFQHWNADGTYLSFSGNGTLGDSPAGRSNEFGSWERIERRLFASSGSFLRYDTQTGAHIGSTRLDRTIRLSDDGDSFAVVTRAQVLDLDGTVVTTLFSRASGERMQIERIAEEP